MTHSSTLLPCIIAGGSGTRLWPVSRATLPKPFIRLADDQSLLQKTFLRASEIADVDRVLTVTNREVFFRTLDEYRDKRLTKALPNLDFVLEPFGRNTAPAIAAAALLAERLYGPQTQLLVLPADHLIRDQSAFANAVAQARELASQGYLVTFGLRPHCAETGFGYIEQGEALPAGGFRVERFVEKPDKTRAEAFLADGRHLWNAGMFCLPVDVLLAEFAALAPDVLEAVRNCLEHTPLSEHPHYRQADLDAESFAAVPDISIDYAVMERSSKVAVVPCELGWSDIGSWQAMSELTPADADDNRIIGETVLHDVKGCYIEARSRLIGALGVENLIIVDTPDALLIAAADRSQDVRILTRELQRRDHDAFRLHRTVTRPWGTYTVLEDGARFKIKRIIVQPGASLSLQMHHHRSEHWVVVCGMAKVTNGERDFLLATNESTFIPAGHLHRLSNPGVVDLVMIEVQSGEYLGEDDIVRYDDIYGRTPTKVNAL